MPPADSLPAGLKDLAFRNSVVVRNDPDFNPDINNLITAIEKRVKGSSSRLPLIAGVIAAVLIIAALLIFVVLPGMNTPAATSTPTAEIIVVPTTAPTDEPTDEPTSVPTDSPTEAPTIAPTDEPTAEATEAATEAVASAADLTPTVLYPDGRALQLLYNDTSFYVHNPATNSRATIAFTPLKFEALDADGNPIDFSYSGSRWATVSANLTAQGCGALEPVQLRQFLRPSRCEVYNANRNNLQSSEYFWRTVSGGVTFRVLWNDEEVGRCPVQAGSNRCDILIPPA
ncbi:MAG: PT domain-containing protein [Anaerolineae bacterium]|nr:PT domain-containing protein [Anaerolineae bacterium]